MANRYWVGGSGTWNTTSTTNWSASSGGSSGASVPTAADSVFFDQTGTYTVTMTGSLTCLDITVSAGTVTFATGTSPTIAISGSMSLLTGTVWSATATLTFNATTTGKTVTTNGVSLSGGVTFNGTGGAWSLGSALTSTGIITIIRGSFSTANYNVTCSALSSNVTNTRSIILGSSTVSLTSGGSVFSINSASGLTWDAETSQINFTALSTTDIVTPGITFYNVAFTSGFGASGSISGVNTFNTLSFPSRTLTPGIATFTFNDDQTITTLVLNAGTTAAYRTFLASNTIGTQRTLAVTTLTAGAADYDFRDIAITGAAAPLTGTRFGDCKGNSGVTFPAAKTVYYRLATAGGWGAVSPLWAFTNGGTADATAFPLAQDTAVFPSSPTPYPSSGVTTTIGSSYNIGTIDMSARTTNTMTLATGTAVPTVYGNWINGTGTTLTGTGILRFSGRGSQTITSAGKTFSQPIIIYSPGGSVTLQDAFSTSASSSLALAVQAGTFDASTYNVTLSGAASAVNISSSNTRTLAFGSGTWTITGTGGFVATITTGLSVTGTGTISLTSASAKTFAGGGIQTYPTLNQGGTGALTISGSNGFRSMTNTAVGSVLFTGGTTNTFSVSFSLNGALANLLTLGSTNTTQAILKKPTSWQMGLTSMDMGNNTGLTFLSSDGTMSYLSVSYINGQLYALPYMGNFFAFF